MAVAGNQRPKTLVEGGGWVTDSGGWGMCLIYVFWVMWKMKKHKQKSKTLFPRSAFILEPTKKQFSVDQ